jgi:glycosyltransferase involved in cell wall biosynthesis
VRVVHVTDRLTDRGGAHRHLLSVTRALAERGHEVHIVAGATGTLGEDLPASIHRLAGLDSRTSQPVELDALLRRLAPDVVHVHTVMNPCALERAASWGAVFTVQDHRSFCPARGKWTAAGEVCQVAFSPVDCAACFDHDRYRDEMLGLTRARLASVQRSTVIVLSEYMRGELVQAGLQPGRVHVVPPFVDFREVATARAPEAPPCVLFVGRLVEAKGPLDSVDAWRRSGVALPLVVAGTGPLRSAVAAAGADVLGWVPHAELPAIFRRARALLMSPLWQEPFGMVGLEALSFGVPVVSWDSGGIREWHPGPLVRRGDGDGLAAALREAIGTRAVAPAAFHREDMMRRLERAYAGAPRAA